MFSIITIEASTIIPTPRIRPVKVIILRVMPAKFMARRVIMIERGMEMAIMRVDFTDFKNKKRMITARIRPV